MKRLGIFKQVAEIVPKTISRSDLKEGINDVGNYFIKVSANNQIDYIIDKICNHAGGRLILRNSKAVCPMHGWQLDLNSLEYSDSHICKERLNYDVDLQGNIVLNDVKSYLVNPFKGIKKGLVKLRWLNHATVYIECNGKSIITDPWLFGPAFMTGWWLASPSPADAIELLKNADFVFVSHNHPDHLHPETLSLLSKDKEIIVADFATESCAKYLKSLGFDNVTSLAFNEIFELTPGLQISILKSGDFRDDSGIYISANGHEILLTVDSNFLNSYILPKKIDILFTSFAGSASGFPLCFDNYSQAEKEAIIKRNRGSIKFSVGKYLKATEPSYYMPYAGMFKETSFRDSYIQQHNIKNTTEDFKFLAENSGAELLQPLSNQQLIFQDGVLTKANIDTVFLKKEDSHFYISKLKEQYPYNASKIINYLKTSGYKNKQILQIIPTNDSFMEATNDLIFADFYNNVFKIISTDELIEAQENYRVMQLRIRPEILMCVVENNLPWEDFSIGFQMRVKRFPNQYESDFWYHFTNIYISDQNYRYSSFCGSCTVINQNPIWLEQ